MKLFLSVLLVLSSIIVFSQSELKQDSIQITKVVQDFYDWYIDEINNDSIPNYAPYFKSDTNGMTTLHLDTYINNLYHHGFSDSLVKTELHSYDYCINELQKIPFNQMDSLLQDLDQYEAIACDFFNYYRWGGGQEGMDGIRIDNCQIINHDSKVSITLFNLQEETPIYWRTTQTIIELKRNKETWKITKIK